MKSITFLQTSLFNQSAGRSAIASGLIGIGAVSFLIAYLVLRSDNFAKAMLMGNFHDVAVIFQFLFLVPVAITLQKLSQQNGKGMSRATLITGISAIFLTSVFLLLGLIKAMAVVVYMLPQGIFGVWLIIACWQLRGVLSPGLRWFGIVVGFGLALVGTFPLEYAIFVNKIILQMPAAPDEEVAKIPISHANMIAHQVLWLGSPLGVLTLPFWTLLFARRLLRKIDTTQTNQNHQFM